MCTYIWAHYAVTAAFSVNSIIDHVINVCQKFLINTFVIFVSVYYFNKCPKKCRKSFCRIARVK